MGFIELDGKIIKEIESITFEKFHKIGNLVPLEDIESAFKDLLCEIERLKEKLVDEIEQREEYYKPKSEYEIIGMREDDFH